MSDTDSLGRPEVKVFARFARVCPLEIVLESIEKRPPPEPDIRCKTGQGEPLAFELVEIIDQDLARKVADQWRLSRELREAYEALPERDVGEIRAGLGNAVVNVEFVEGSSIGARRAARGSVLQALKSVPRNFEGVMGLTLPIVEQVQVARGNLAGPSFDVDAGGAVGDPTAASILGKCAKRYTVDIPVELLAHFELHPMFPDDVWLPQGACGGVPGPGRLSVPSRLGVRRPTGIDPLRVSGVTRRPSRALARRKPRRWRLAGSVHVLKLLFMKYVSDKYAGKRDALIEVPRGGSFADMVKLKGDKEIGDKINKIISRISAPPFTGASVWADQVGLGRPFSRRSSPGARHPVPGPGAPGPDRP